MHFTYQVNVTVERISGKFVSRDEMAEAITDALDDASTDPYSMGPDGDSEYEVIDLTIEEQPWGKGTT